MSRREWIRGSRGVRIWLDELPDGAEFECTGRVTGPIVPAASSTTVSAILAEMASLSNHWQYAVLGGRFEPTAGGQFHIDACIGHTDGPTPDWLFAKPGTGFGSLTVRLSETYADLVASLPTQFTDAALPAGVLHICCAVESEMATSVYSVCCATFLILRTLARGTLPDDEDQLLAEANAARKMAAALLKNRN